MDRALARVCIDHCIVNRGLTDPAEFFSRGTSGQWRDLPDDADLARYAARVRALAPGNLVEWVHREPID
jgi:aryl sulfotransferase